MRIALHTNIISPHQLPFARELVEEIGERNFRYIYTESLHEERSSMGWRSERISWLLDESSQSVEAREWLENADVVFSGHRKLDLFERRTRLDRKTFYFSERWFKPIVLGNGMIRLPGKFRMWVPGYRKMALRMIRLINGTPSFRYFPMGVHAREDLSSVGAQKDKMILWGYFVATSCAGGARPSSPRRGLRILWVGRMLDWKRVDTLVRAMAVVKQSQTTVGEGVCASLTLVGDGPQKNAIRELTRQLGLEKQIAFLSSQPIDSIRELMRLHDLYVLPSDSNEGWGAAVNEALEEGMRVVGTWEAGASATLLPPERLFRAGDYRALAELIQREQAGTLPDCGIGEWTAKAAAKRFLELCT